MTDEHLIAASDECFYDGWRAMASAAGGFVHEQDGILIAAPGVGPVWVNLLFVTEPLRDPERQLADAFALLDERSIPFLVRIRDGLDAVSEDAAGALGMKYTDTIPGMALAPIPTDGGRDAPLEIREVADDETFADFAAVTAASFGFASNDARRLVASALRSTTGTFWYVGYLNSESVAASQVQLLKNGAGINFIGTLEAHRGKGFGEAMTWQAVNKGAHEGRAVAALQASEMGKPVYERMGFRTVTGYKTFVRPEWT